MNEKLYTLDPSELTAEERRTAAFLASGSRLYDLGDYGVGYTMRESTQLLNAVDKIRRFYKSDYYHGDRFAEKFFQFYLMNSRTESRIMAIIAEEGAAIERVKTLAVTCQLYRETAKKVEVTEAREKLSQAIKAITHADPIRDKRIKDAACAMAAWDGITQVAAAAYGALELKKLSFYSIVGKRARTLDYNLEGVLYDLNNLDLLNKKQAGNIGDILERREIGDYFSPQILPTLSRRKTVNDFLTFEPAILPDIYSRLYDEKSNAIRIAQRHSDKEVGDEF